VLSRRRPRIVGWLECREKDHRDLSPLTTLERLCVSPGSSKNLTPAMPQVGFIKKITNIKLILIVLIVRQKPRNPRSTVEGTWRTMVPIEPTWLGDKGTLCSYSEGLGLVTSVLRHIWVGNKCIRLAFIQE
jgi:hypothetical protein